MKYFESVYRNNTHQTHFEDLVFLGKDGLDELNNKIEGLFDELKGNDKGFNYTTKIDGSPALICWHKFPGYPDDSICLKSFVASANNAMLSEQDILDKYGDRPDMAQKLIYGLELAKYIPDNQAWQGDCLFSNDDKKIEKIRGTEYITFHPNKIVYAFSEDNPDYDKVKNAKFGIAFHTIYTDAGDGKKKQSFRIDPTKINAPDSFFIMSPALNYKADSFDVKDIQDKYKQLQSLEDELESTNDYEALVNNDTFMTYWSTFENKNIADKRKVTLDPDKFYEDLYDYIDEKRTGEWTKKNASLKTKKGRAKALDDYTNSISSLHDILKSNKGLLSVLVAAFNLAAEIKMDMWAGFRQSKASYSTFYKSKSKGIIDADMEGVAMSDSDGNIVKIVDRSTFSANNRDPDIISGWEHPEDSRTLESSSLNKLYGQMLREDNEAADTIVFAFGRLNPPTIGHQKLVDKLLEQAAATKNHARLYLSHSVDKKREFKNPLPYDIKLDYVRKAFDDKVDVMDSPAKTIVNVLHELYEDGFKNIVYVGGEDRIGGDEDMTEIINKYNGYKDTKPELYYEFSNISFVSAGDRDEDSDDLAVKASASLARSYVVEGDLDSFKQIMPFDEKTATDLFDELTSIYSTEQSLPLKKAKEAIDLHSAFHSLLQEAHGSISDTEEADAMKDLKYIIIYNVLGLENKNDKNPGIVVNGHDYTFQLSQADSHAREILRLQPNFETEEPLKKVFMQDMSDLLEQAVLQKDGKSYKIGLPHGENGKLDLTKYGVFGETQGTSSTFEAIPVAYYQIKDNKSDEKVYTAYIALNTKAKKLFTPNKLLDLKAKQRYKVSELIADAVKVKIPSKSKSAEITAQEEAATKFFKSLLEAASNASGDENFAKFMEFRKALDDNTSYDDAKQLLSSSTLILTIPLQNFRATMKDIKVIDLKKIPRSIKEDLSSVFNDFGEVLAATAITSAMSRAEKNNPNKKDYSIEFPEDSNYPLADFFIHRKNDAVSVSAKNGAGGKATVSEPFRKLRELLKSNAIKKFEKGNEHLLALDKELLKFMQVVIDQQADNTEAKISVNKQFNKFADLLLGLCGYNKCVYYKNARTDFKVLAKKLDEAEISNLIIKLATTGVNGETGEAIDFKAVTEAKSKKTDDSYVPNQVEIIVNSINQQLKKQLGRSLLEGFNKSSYDAAYEQEAKNGNKLPNNNSYVHAYKTRAFDKILVEVFNKSELKQRFNTLLNLSLGTFMQDYMNYDTDSTISDFNMLVGGSKDIKIKCLLKSYDGQALSKVDAIDYDLVMDCSIENMATKAKPDVKFGFKMKSLAMKLNHSK